MKVYLLLTLVCFLSGCGGVRHIEDTTGAVTPYDAASLHNMRLGRDYVMQGRYELAKEHYLLALAASKDPETRDAINRELRSTDMMIKTQR